MAKVIVRIKGGIGNQLFEYSAARRLAHVNDAELVVDHVTGFIRDRLHRSTYQLDRFAVHGRKATRAERMEPFEPVRRVARRWVDRRRPFEERRYLEQEGNDFDPRLLSLRVDGTVYLDGYWQSEGYFADIEPIIRRELQIVAPEDDANRSMAGSIRGEPSSVAVHVRWFDFEADGSTANASIDYYRRAIAAVREMVDGPRFFVFSDNPTRAVERLGLGSDVATPVMHNLGRDKAFADLWLMMQCQHFVTANSTFSWWGAWLGHDPRKMVVTPDASASGHAYWGFDGLIPDGWIRL